jgi:hypothetical protein
MRYSNSIRRSTPLSSEAPCSGRRLYPQSTTPSAAKATQPGSSLSSWARSRRRSAQALRLLSPLQLRGRYHRPQAAQFPPRPQLFLHPMVLVESAATPVWGTFWANAVLNGDSVAQLPITAVWVAKLVLESVVARAAAAPFSFRAPSPPAARPL